MCHANPFPATAADLEHVVPLESRRPTAGWRGQPCGGVIEVALRSSSAILTVCKNTKLFSERESLLVGSPDLKYKVLGILKQRWKLFR